MINSSFRKQQMHPRSGKSVTRALLWVAEEV